MEEKKIEKKQEEKKVETPVETKVEESEETNPVKAFYKKHKIKSAIITLSLFGIYFASAFLNGFYVYPCTLLAMPIIMYCVQPKKDEN